VDWLSRWRSVWPHCSVDNGDSIKVTLSYTLSGDKITNYYCQFVPAKGILLF